jgi:hypothetical protein
MKIPFLMLVWRSSERSRRIDASRVRAPDDTESVESLASLVVERVLAVYRPEYVERCAREEPNSLLGLVKRLEKKLAEVQP